MNAQPPHRRVTGAVIRAVRDGWLILGITFALWLALEGLYRAQGSLRRALRTEAIAANSFDSPDHPNAQRLWWRELTADLSGSVGGGLRYDPFRGWWPRGQRARHVNVDADGRRVTVQPPLAPGSRRAIYMFGGSVMWGWLVRDSFTIPSLVATRMRERGYHDVEVVNLAQSTFDLAQNAATFMQELRHGRVPTAAVFLDGNNEIAPVFQYGQVGRILNEDLIARRFERRSDLASDLSALLQHSELVRRVQQRADSSPTVDRLHLCEAVAGSYSRQVRELAAVAVAFHVEPIFLWQPMRATSRKPLGKWERQIRSTEQWPGMVRRCTALVDSALARQPRLPFFTLSASFDHDSADVFIDDYGHMTERGNIVVADSIIARLAERLGAPGAGLAADDQTSSLASSRTMRRKRSTKVPGRNGS